MHNSAATLADRLADAVTTRALLPLRNGIKKDYRYSYVADVDQFNELSHTDIVSHQLDRLRRIVSVASNNSDFYSERVRSAGIHDITNMSFKQFTQIEPITKADLRYQHGAMINRSFAREDLVKRRSGGTTSMPVPIFLDLDSINRRESATASFNRWFGFRPGQKIAYLWAATQDLPDMTRWKARVQNKFVDRRLFLPSGVIDDEIMEAHCRQLQAFRPTLLQAYPNPLADLADYVLRTGRKIELNAISTTAEALIPDQRARIKKAFGADPFAWYGAREAGRIATQCRVREGMHINCYGLYLEVIEDASYTSEKSGDILVTDLWNEGMPIIRYSIGDVGNLETETCGCGSNLPRLSGLLGRTTDTFLNSKRQRIPGIVLQASIHGDRNEIHHLQIIQHDIGKFEAVIVPGNDFENPTSIELLRERLSAYIGEGVELEARIVQEIPREPSGKVRTCKNEMKDIE